MEVKILCRNAVLGIFSSPGIRCGRCVFLPGRAWPRTGWYSYCWHSRWSPKRGNCLSRRRSNQRRRKWYDTRDPVAPCWDRRPRLQLPLLAALSWWTAQCQRLAAHGGPCTRHSLGHIPRATVNDARSASAISDNQLYVYIVWHVNFAQQLEPRM